MQEYLNLDLLTLGALSEQAGRPIEPETYLASLAQAKADGNLFEVRQDAQLVAYATLKNLGAGHWFVLMFVIHPKHRKRRTLIELFGKIIAHLDHNDATVLTSNVLRINQNSVNFHQHLGFKITREADHGFEFTLALDSPEARQWRYWTQAAATAYSDSGSL